ncbi:unnamed protein product [Symbiodinium natans]|uniref:Uncharacterized protein n=1 Tax=Symbiodinium natans TaxID=878477 RepID=A0A812SKB8_9DINO|nr:unnamed protein product [Symbiodinium natans]
MLSHPVQGVCDASSEDSKGCQIHKARERSLASYLRQGCLKCGSFGMQASLLLFRVALLTAGPFFTALTISYKDRLSENSYGALHLDAFFVWVLGGLCCLSTRKVPKMSSFILHTRGWFFMMFLTAVLSFSTDRCWRLRAGAFDSAFYKRAVSDVNICRVHGGAMWQLLVVGMVWQCWLLKLRVAALDQGRVCSRENALHGVFILQTVLLFAGLYSRVKYLVLRFNSIEPSAADEHTAGWLRTGSVMLLLVALVLTTIAYLRLLPNVKSVAKNATGRQEAEARRVLRASRIHVIASMAATAVTVMYTAMDMCNRLTAWFDPAATWRTSDAWGWSIKVMFGVDLIVNGCAMLILSGGVLAQTVPACCDTGSANESIIPPKPSSSECSECPQWQQKVRELSQRGLSLDALLKFYGQLGRDCMPHYRPDLHTTADVVRQAIIPGSAATAFGSCAMATVLMQGVATPAQRMVTHAWSNLFADLVAAVVADALDYSSYADVRERLKPGKLGHLYTELQQQDLLQLRYWICAFCVNQHAGICAGNPNQDRDPVTLQLHPVCDCGHPKFWNDTEPCRFGRSDGESVGCEMNKFSDMMSLLASHDPLFRQVVAVDQKFDLFSRAWCVAEISQAYSCNMGQRLLFHSQSNLDMHRESLDALKVEEMQASRPEDVKMILRKIGDVARFNDNLRWMILDEEKGLLKSWKDATDIANVVRRIAYRQRAV